MHFLTVLKNPDKNEHRILIWIYIENETFMQKQFRKPFIVVWLIVINWCLLITQAWKRE